MYKYEIEFLKQDGKTYVEYEVASNAHEAWFQLTKRVKDYWKMISAKRVL